MIRPVQFVTIPLLACGLGSSCAIEHVGGPSENASSPQPELGSELRDSRGYVMCRDPVDPNPLKFCVSTCPPGTSLISYHPNGECYEGSKRGPKGCGGPYLISDGGVLTEFEPHGECDALKDLRYLCWTEGQKDNYCLDRGYDGVFLYDGSYNKGGVCYKGDEKVCRGQVPNSWPPWRH
jgi:hypothetical protein